MTLRSLSGSSARVEDRESPTLPSSAQGTRGGKRRDAQPPAWRTRGSPMSLSKTTSASSSPRSFVARPRRQEKNFWAGLAMQRLIKSSCRARSTPFYLIRYERRASQVQLVHLLEEVSLLTGALSFVMFALFCRRHVRVRSCPANFGEVDVPCLLVRISEC